MWTKSHPCLPSPIESAYHIEANLHLVLKCLWCVFDMLKVHVLILRVPWWICWGVFQCKLIEKYHMLHSTSGMTKICCFAFFYEAWVVFWTDSSNSSACGADDCCRGKRSEKSINVLFLIRLIIFFLRDEPQFGN